MYVVLTTTLCYLDEREISTSHKFYTSLPEEAEEEEEEEEQEQVRKLSILLVASNDLTSICIGGVPYDPHSVRHMLGGIN
jgi:hypothetical protein